MNRAELPKELQAIIGAEKVDFITYATRKQPLSNSFGIIVLGIIWLSFSSIITYILIGPLWRGEDVHFTFNGDDVTANMDNLTPAMAPILIASALLLTGVAFLTWGIISLLKKGGYYVGTESRIIHYLNGNIQYFGWDQFTGNVELNFKKKNISLEMRKGNIKSISDTTKAFTRGNLHLSGIEDLTAIEQICRKRMKEYEIITPEQTT